MTDGVAEKTAGWYRDPAPANPAFPTSLRFWDGRDWTTQTKPASKAQRNAWRHEDAVRAHEQAVARQQQAEALGVPLRPPPGMVYAEPRGVTPDGQLLASWGSRLGAIIIDGIIVSILSTAFSWPWIKQVATAYENFLSSYVASSQAGSTAPPDTNALVSSVMGPLVMVVVIGLAVRFVYSVGFLKGFAATPGKMALGIEVRLRERPGPMPWGTVLLRWLGQSLATLVSVVPLGFIPGGLYWWLDYLWPLWDGKRQALHDKIARTNVVRR